MANKSRYTPRKTGMIIDTVHIVIGVLVVVMAVFAIANPAEYMSLFPLIFLLAALLLAVTGWFMFLTGKHNTRKKAAGVVYFCLAALLIFLFAVSAISIWGNR